MMRWKMRSTQPPKKPCIAPATMPITDERRVTISVNSIDSRKP